MTFNWLPRSSYNALLSAFFCLALVFVPSHTNIAHATQTLKFGVLPDNDPEIIKRRFAPLLGYIERETGLKVELVIPESYEDLLAQFQNKSIDLALFGGYTFIKAQQESHAEALVMRDIDLQFSTVFITQANNPKQNIADFKKARFSFGARLSTSGHIMPRYFLIDKNITPETFFNEIHYSNGHDTTVYSVRNGQVDLGAVNSEVVKNMLTDGRLKKNEIRVVWKTPTYTDYVWAIQPNSNELLSDELLSDRLLDCFLNLSLQNDTHRKVLTALGANSFLPANNKDFEALRKAAKLMPQ